MFCVRLTTKFYRYFQKGYRKECLNISYHSCLLCFRHDRQVKRQEAMDPLYEMRQHLQYTHRHKGKQKEVLKLAPLTYIIPSYVVHLFKQADLSVSYVSIIVLV